MASLFHRSKQRRAERAPITAHGNINLVPLVDILTSIVFFSLLTYTGATMLALTAFDLTLPPTVVTAEGARNSAQDPQLNLLLAVRIEGSGLQVEHSDGLSRRIPSLDGSAMDTLQAMMVQIKQQYPQNNDVLVVPSDEVNYETVVRVFERLRQANFTNLALGNRARLLQQQQAAAAAGRQR
jgi:biopolymer transport protein TolR